MAAARAAMEETAETLSRKRKLRQKAQMQQKLLMRKHLQIRALIQAMSQRKTHTRFIVHIS